MAVPKSRSRPKSKSKPKSSSKPGSKTDSKSAAQEIPSLCTDFEAAARNLCKGMKILAERIREADGKGDLKTPAALAAFRLNLPPEDVGCWVSRQNNCYNFALNRFSGDFLQPGRHAAVKDEYNRASGTGTKVYFRGVHRGAQADGLEYLGQDFEEIVRANKAVRPVALFIRGKPHSFDYHWFSLRRSGSGLFNRLSGSPVIWAHKMGGQDAVLCKGRDFGEPKGAGIFSAAREESYDYFAGYYNAPLALELKAPA